MSKGTLPLKQNKLRMSWCYLINVECSDSKEVTYFSCLTYLPKPIMPADPRDKHCKRRVSTGQSILPDWRACWDFRFKATSAREVAGMLFYDCPPLFTILNQVFRNSHPIKGPFCIRSHNIAKNSMKYRAKVPLTTVTIDKLANVYERSKCPPAVFVRKPAVRSN